MCSCSVTFTEFKNFYSHLTQQYPYWSGDDLILLLKKDTQKVEPDPKSNIHPLFAAKSFKKVASAFASSSSMSILSPSLMTKGLLVRLRRRYTSVLVALIEPKISTFSSSMRNICRICQLQAHLSRVIAACSLVVA